VAHLERWAKDMAGAQIICGDFEGQDKSGSPIGAVLSEVYRRSYGRSPRGKIGRFFGRARTGIEGLAEDSVVSVRFDELAKIPSEVCAHFFPAIAEYQKEVLSRLGIADDVDSIVQRMERSMRAKYGGRRDDGWHAYCLHDLVIAFERSARTQEPVEVQW
jgi:hypothetical protein